MGFGNGGRQTRFVDVILNLGAVAAFVSRYFLGINVVSVDFVPRFRQNGRVRQPHKSGANNNNFHLIHSFVSRIVLRIAYCVNISGTQYAIRNT